jgi:hypothetical protein
MAQSAKMGNISMSTTCHAHVAVHSRSGVTAVNYEVVAPGFAADCFVDALDQQRIAFTVSQRCPKISGIVLPQAHVQRPGASQPNAVAGLAEIMSKGSDET